MLLGAAAAEVIPSERPRSSTATCSPFTILTDAIIRSPDYVKIANASTNKNASYKSMVIGGFGGRSQSEMRAGGTLVLDQLHHREPKLGLLCQVLAAELGHDGFKPTST